MTSRTSTSWEPLLSGSDAEPAWQVVLEIAAELPAWLDRPAATGSGSGLEGPSLATGLAGLALFYAYLDRARPGAGFDERAFELVERAIDGLASPELVSSFYAGFTGVAWTVEHLQALYGEAEPEADGGESDGEDDEDLNAEIDQALLPLLATSPWPWDYELIRGLVGFGLHGVDRLGVPSGGEILRRVVDRLAELAEERDSGTVTWHTRQELIFHLYRDQYPEGQDNLGLSHGMPGVIALFAEICLTPAARDALGAGRVETVRDLLRRSVAWLLAQHLDGPAARTSCFPAQIIPGEAPVPTRTAWCYGDPGVAAALVRAARALGDAGLERRALDTASRAFRRPVGEMQIDDATLCHGTAGLLHLGNRFWQASGEDSFRDAARHWAAETLARREPGRGVAGFRALMPDQGGAYLYNDPGLLTGTAGIGLALLAAVSRVEPRWDRMLLVDLVPGASRLAAGEGA